MPFAPVMPRSHAFFVLVSFGGLLAADALIKGPWSDASLPPDKRAALLAGNMTLAEKLSMLGGVSGPYVGNIAANPRLDIPPVNMNDGPQGFRDEAHPRTSTSWPSGLAMAASWDEEAVFNWGRAMAAEFRAKGANVQLGPGLCLARVPLNGRNFEYLSGEDPYLGFVLAQQAVRGIQSQGVVANAKHWVLNNQETNRMEVSSEAGERVRFEMYYPPFDGAIRAGVGSFMCGYNKINGAWSCENHATLAGDLKGALGFKGYVMSDWGATHSPSIMQGLDNEQPGSDYMNPEILGQALLAGAVTHKAVDESVRRILWSMFSAGVFDQPTSTWDPANLARNVTTNQSLTSARAFSAESTVLLKNERGVLPIAQGKRIAVIGLADGRAVTHGGGSGEVVGSYVVTPLEGIAASAGTGAVVSFTDGRDVDAAVRAARDADVAIVFAAAFSEEGADRPNLSATAGVDGVIPAVCRVAPTVVVGSFAGAAVMPWSADAAAVLINFMPGQQGGNAIADVLFGRVNPSGKLPLTFPNKENETLFEPAQYPGVPDASKPSYAFYTEGLLVGYRYYDHHDIKFKTGFPFGHGLSYTTFKYSDLAAASVKSVGIEVSFLVTNIGEAHGREVAQVYLRFPDKAGEPPQQLKRFRKTRVLERDAAEVVAFRLARRDLSIWCEINHSWKVVGGTFEVRVGSSSRDIRLTQTVVVDAGDFVQELHV